MDALVINFRLPSGRAIFESDHLFSRGRLTDGNATIFEFDGTANRELTTTWQGHELALMLPEATTPDPNDLALVVDGEPALREDRMRLSASRSAWMHAFIALFASFAGFVASYLYMVKADASSDAWALKMGIHTAGWHLLLTLTLFPASVWGQRIGIRAVQFVSFVFFCIHLGIAIANFVDPSPHDGPWIAIFNALSGAFFLGAVFYGQRAHRDMNPAHR